MEADERRPPLIKIHHAWTRLRTDTRARAMASVVSALPVRVDGLRKRIAACEPAVLAAGAAMALAAAAAAGERSPIRLGVLVAACAAAGLGGVALGTGASASGAARLAASQLAGVVLGPWPCLSLLAGGAVYAAFAGRPGARSPFGVVAAGAAAGLAVLGGWQTTAGLDVTVSLLAAVVFLWTPTLGWSREIARGRGPLATAAGAERAAAAIVATAAALVPASLLLATRVALPFGAVAAAADAILLAATLALRRRPDTAAAKLAGRASTAYLVAVLAGVALA
jgi:hypothetical protein